MNLGNDLKWLIGSDFHIPYDHPRAMNIWWQVMEWFEPDVIDIAGDLDDQLCFSRFSDKTPDEIMNAAATYAHLVQDFFKKCRDIRPDAQIHFATGNHDIRYETYIDKKAPAIKGLITPETLWKTDTYGIELSHYNNPPVHRFGDIYVHHGLYALSNAGTSAKKLSDEFGVSCIVGHSHRQGYMPKSYPLKGETVRSFELGHMTDIHSEGMAYDPKHDWQMGFAVGHIVNDYPHISLIGINEDFECVVDGKVFRG